MLHRRTREGMRGALAQFQQAITLDSTYAPAYAGLTAVSVLWDIYGYRGIDSYEAFGRAVAMADRAISLDSDLAEAYGARAWALTRAGAPADEISADFKRALELQPNSADVREWHALFLSRQDRHGEALAESERAVALDPLARNLLLGPTRNRSVAIRISS